MRKRMVAAALVAAFFFSAPAAAQLNCGPRAQVEADLAAEALQVVAQGEDIRGTYFWWFANAATGLWVIIARPVNAPDLLCVMTLGQAPAAAAERRSKPE